MSLRSVDRHELHFPFLQPNLIGICAPIRARPLPDKPPGARDRQLIVEYTPCLVHEHNRLVPCHYHQ